MEKYRTLAGQAARQHGLFLQVQAQGYGLSRKQVRGLVGSGWCERVCRDVYRVRAAPRTVEQKLLIAVWRAGPDSVASHRSAAYLWGVAGFGGRDLEVTRPRGRSQRTEFGTIHGSLQLPASHVGTRAGVPVTTAARTAFDLAGVISPKQLEQVVDDLIHRRVCTAAQMQHVFFALARRGRRGTVAMRDRLEAIGAGYVPPASELERRGRRLIDESDLPPPRVEVHLGGADWIGRVDLLWERERVVVELDGDRFHGSRLQRDADRQRDNALMAAGWRVLRITWDDLVDRPEGVVAWIRDALSSAA